jgi:hypothetical protein
MRLVFSTRFRRLSSLSTLTVLAATTGAMCVVPVPAQASLVAATAPSSIKIPANFVYVGSAKTGRCLWGVGVEFPTVPKATSYTIQYFDGYYNAWEETGTTVPIPASDELGHGMNYAGITGGGGPPPCISNVTQGGRFIKPIKAWANFPGKAPDTGAIEGTVTDADGDPVQGALVTSYGPTHATAVSGPGGIYYMTVDAGSYRVVPDDSSVKKSSFAPTDSNVSVPKSGSATADFKLNSGLQVTINMDSATAPASGFAIVKGTVNATKNGKPVPGVTVQLSVDPTSPSAALTSAPKVAVCGTGGRIWPAGNVSDLDGKAVDVVTDANGQYHFSLTVGTVPGDWTFDAWAENQDGSLSTDVSNASDTKVLTVQPVAPKVALADFISSLTSLKGTSYAPLLNPQNAGAFAYQLGTWAAKGSLNSIPFSGLSFSVGSAPDGQDVVISPATTQFRIGPQGQVERSGGMLNSLIVDPQEWTGHGLPSKVSNGASLNYVVQNGFLSDIPTVAEWESGSSGHLGWSLKAQTFNDSTNVLAWWGWAYPPPAVWPSGYCQ